MKFAQGPTRPAIGLIFAGLAELPESLRTATETNTVPEIDPATVKPKRIESYDVANPISEVLDRLKIDLLV